MKILIHTDSQPTTRLGGPGKFCPILHKQLLLRAGAEEEYVGYFGGQLLRSPWTEPPTVSPVGNQRSSGKVALLKMPYIGQWAYRYKHTKDALSLKKHLAESKVDLIHCHDYSGVVSISDQNVPVIFTNHFKGSLYKEFLSSLPEFQGNAWRNYFRNQEKKAILRSDLMTFPSESAKQLLLDDWPSLESEINGKSVIIYSGIADPATLGTTTKSERSMVVMNVANHIHDKGIDTAIRVFKELRRQYPNLRFRNFGTPGPETEELHNLTAALGLSDSVEWMGAVPFNVIVENLYQSAMLIHSPRRVVFDLSLLEAMACEIPILATDVKGNVEALGENHPLWIDHVNEEIRTADWMGGSLRGAFFQEIGQTQRMRCLSLFSLDAMADNYRNLYLNYTA